jgi:hypothetical protein
MAGIVFNAIAEAHFLQHLQIIIGPHADALRLEVLPVFSKCATRSSNSALIADEWPDRACRAKLRTDSPDIGRTAPGCEGSCRSEDQIR